MTVSKLKEMDAMENLFDAIAEAQEMYRDGGHSRGGCILTLEDLISEIKVTDLEKASEIAEEYGMKLVPRGWKRDMSKDA